jgi:hypothetical protein
MFTQNALLSRAGTIATLLLGTVFSAALFAADSAPVQRVSVTSTPGGGTGSPAEIYANSHRGYPASCLNDGLPFGKSNLYTNVQTVALTLQMYDSTTGGYSPETESLSVWRVPCVGGVAATVLELDRPSANNGSTTKYPIFPSIYITTAANGTTHIFPRLAQEPNTRFEDVSAQYTLDGYTFIYSSTAFVFDYYDASNSRYGLSVDYNQAFTLNVDNLASGGAPLVLQVPAYIAPTTPALMEISGYMTTNWTSQTQGGEGIVMQVYDNADHATRELVFAWFTYNEQGLPFWLYGEGSLPIGATSVTAQTAYFKGGTFAPATVSAAVPPTIWGTVTFTFPDCGHMKIVYNGDASAVHGPKGNSTATFARVADVNGLVCQ